MRPRPPFRREREPTIALINIVFLMLIFFLIAGTLAPPSDPGLRLLRVADLDAAPPPDGLVVRADGTALHRGTQVSPEEFGAAGGTIRVIPDRDLPAHELLRIARALQAAGAEAVVVVGEMPQ
jgi:biopolymer transport protein ExbD